MVSLLKTPLYERHVELGARMAGFGGWIMPIQYTGVLEEHRAVRSAAGIFDVSHMGEIRVSGKGALFFLRKLLTSDPASLETGQVQYSLMCCESGGVVDDLLVYRLGEESFLLVVNAGNKDKDVDWLRGHQKTTGHGDSVEIRDISAETGQIAVQGPRSAEILGKLCEAKLEGMRYYSFLKTRVAGLEALVSRTGYTGEDGFEIYLRVGETKEAWDRIMEAGKPAGLVPAGLGARDTLRLEASMPLYGHELSQSTTPLEAGLERFVSWGKGGFIGREALEQEKREGVKKKLVGFVMVERGVPRAGYELLKMGRVIGKATSGSYAPSLDGCLGMGYVQAQEAVAGNRIEVMIRGRWAAAEIVNRPFYKKKGGWSNGRE
ncbi:MAG: glycine cleavage system aminomethyltransferase GcvT [Peptococcaceae bacterium]|jgi:aminomethyltransferase|nr:glycine cleavage system aminomethyltransferase GcvT [Peptococcaceae bacterium]MDH7524316.1 glycine cleavage system aminomethyltransferase GcvT [Peptococcaceae bacterium]